MSNGQPCQVQSFTLWRSGSGQHRQRWVTQLCDSHAEREEGGGGRALVSILKNGAHEPVGADHRAWSHLSLPTERRLGVRARGSREGGRHTAGLLAPAASGGAQLRCALEISSLSVSLSVPLGAVK